MRNSSKKHKLYRDLVISPLVGHKYILRESFFYKGIVVPKGFVTNGADVPRIFWNIFPPNRSDYLPAVVVHDYLCSLEQYDIADILFREILEDLGLGKFDIMILYGGVRLYSLLIRPIIKGIFG